jgi:hypothetical protein
MAKASGEHDPFRTDSDDEDDDEEADDAAAAGGGRPTAKKAKKVPKKPTSIWPRIWMYYWGAHQRFFRSLCISCKVPALLAQVEAALLEGKCCVVGLQSTGEAAAGQAVGEGDELDDFISTPAAILDKVTTSLCCRDVGNGLISVLIKIHY